ncbi:MAG TPA: hypothetical protein VM285_04035, partial [Polyangia bacterium]|nr:hypothetical protein [Polyangia bacterium]
FEQTNADETFIGRPAASGTNWLIYKSSTNQILGSLGGGFGGSSADLDTITPFATVQRWVNITSHVRRSANNTSLFVDGILRDTVAGGSPSASSIGLGIYHNGTSPFYLEGRMSDVLIYSEDDDEANIDRAVEVERWMRRHRRLATRPGTPFMDVDAQSIAQGDATAVSSWNNDAIPTNDLVQTSTLRPTLYQQGGPEPSVGSLLDNGSQRVDFDGNNDYMESANTFTAITQVGAMAIVFKRDADPTSGANQYLVGSNVGSREWYYAVHNNSGTIRDAPNAGATGYLDPNNHVIGDWHWTSIEVNNTNSHIRSSVGGSTGAITLGSESFGDRVRLGARSTLGSYLNGSVARLIIWDNSVSSWADVNAYLDRRYPGINPYG